MTTTFQDIVAAKTPELATFMKVSSIGALMVWAGAGTLFAVPFGMAVLYLCFFVTFLLTKLIYMVVPQTLENRWKINTWLTIAWFLPAFYLWTACATVMLTFIGFPLYAGTNFVFGNYDEGWNLVINAYGPLLTSFSNEEITLSQFAWKFLVFDADSPIIMIIRVIMTIAGFFYLHSFGAYNPGKTAFMEEENEGHHVALTFEF